VVDVPSQKPPSGSKGHLVVLSRAAAEAALPSLLGMALDYSPSFDRHDVRRKVGVITQADVVGRNLELSGYLFARDFPEVVEEIDKTESGERAERSAGISAGRSTQTVLANASSWKHSLSAVAREARAIAATIRKLRGGRTILSEVDPIAKVDAGQLSSGELGMSYEVTDVEIADTRASIWMLKRVTFMGAAILRRNKAAYRDTWIELVSGE
jgi:hypothetical protein